MPPPITSDMIGEEDVVTHRRGEDTTTSLFGEETLTTDALGEEEPFPVDSSDSPFGAF